MKSERATLVRCALVLSVSLLVGCSSLKPYPKSAEQNLEIRTEAKAGSPFSRLRASLHIYSLDAQCRPAYQGTVDLGEPVVSIGIPANRPSYLVFDFASASFLANTRNVISQETVLLPRPGYRYAIEASYKDDMYGVLVREADLRTGETRTLRLQGLASCSGA